MYLWQLLHRLWALLPIFIAQTLNRNIEKDLPSFWGRNWWPNWTCARWKGTRYIWGINYFGIIVFSCLSFTKACLIFLLICFIWEIKSFHHSSLENKVDFTDIIITSQTFAQIFWLKIKMSKNWDMVLWMKEQWWH